MSPAGPVQGASGREGARPDRESSGAVAAWTHWLIPVGLGVGLAFCLRGLFLAWSQRVPLEVVLGVRLYLVLAGLLVSAGLLGFGALLAWRDARRGRAFVALGPSMRLAFLAAFAMWAALVLWVQPFQRLWFDLAMGVAWGLWAGVLWIHRAAAGGRAWRLAAALAFSLAASTFGLELVLRQWARLQPSPLNATVGAAPGRLIERYRCKPGQMYLGFPCNSRGFYDDEFVRKGNEGPVIAAIGDSFHVGMVPHAWHMTTLCEQALDATVHNIGVAGVGPPEYLSLLVDEALPLEPDAILISLFVGNDLNIVDVTEGLTDAGLRSWFQRDQILLTVVPRRLARIRAERRFQERAARPGLVPANGPALGAALSRSEALAAYPWLADPSLELPSYSPETFLALETDRALAVCAQVPVALDLCFKSLLEARRAAGSIPLLVMLIPDEYQVEDQLWAEVSRRADRPLDRTRPQQLLLAWLKAQNIPALDLLPALRDVPPGPDGSRHLYHLQDTHFNARGNASAAEALATFLAKAVPRAGR